VAIKPEALFGEVKRYGAPTNDDGQLLQAVGTRKERHSLARGERSYDQKFPILLATAHVREDDHRRMPGAPGADSYLQKPIFNPQTLIDTLKGIVATSNSCWASHPRSAAPGLMSLTRESRPSVIMDEQFPLPCAVRCPYGILTCTRLRRMNKGRLRYL